MGTNWRMAGAALLAACSLAACGDDEPLEVSAQGAPTAPTTTAAPPPRPTPTLSALPELTCATDLRAGSVYDYATPAAGAAPVGHQTPELALSAAAGTHFPGMAAAADALAHGRVPQPALGTPDSGLAVGPAGADEATYVLVEAGAAKAQFRVEAHDGAWVLAEADLCPETQAAIDR